ncbi:MAG TPA: OmpA family protein [Candidatus Acidoferrum sp.]|nr:OmpA family protein [Candidatus Acidoferrum sp.]
MKKIMLLSVLVSVFLTACGVKKDYVNQQIADSEARSNSRITEVSTKVDTTAAEVARLDKLSLELSRKTDMAINQAAGFENYQVIWSGEISFGFDKADLDGVAQQILDEAGQKMTDTKHSIVEIAGHTDQIGPKTYNYTLGQRRADAAKRYLALKHGIGLYRMFVISYGKDQPVAAPKEGGGNAKNRRVVVKVWAPPQTNVQ